MFFKTKKRKTQLVVKNYLFIYLFVLFSITENSVLGSKTKRCCFENLGVNLTKDLGVKNLFLSGKYAFYMCSTY